MKAASDFSVRTRAYRFVAEALETDGHVFVHGTPGSGKTTLSLVLMDDYRKKNYDVRLIRSPGEFSVMNQINTNVRTFLVFDDIFGHFSPSPKEYFTYRHLFEDICSLFPNEHSNSSDDIHDQKVRVLFNCRTNVFYDTGPLIQEFRHKLFGVTYSLNRDFKSNVEERKEIFKVHLDKCKLGVSDADLDKVVNLEYTTLGFPLICELYTHQRKVGRDKVVEFFSSPLKYLVQILEELFHAEESSTSAAFLVLLMLNNGNIDKANLLYPSKNNHMGMDKLKLVVDHLPKKRSLPTKLSVAADGMIDTYLTVEDDSITFSHPTIYDAVAFVIGKKNPVFILENCSLSFIVERVCLENDTTVAASADHDLFIKLKPNYKETLLTRLAEDINEETMSLVLSQRSLRARDIFRDFIAIIKKSNRLFDVLHLRDRTASMSFLFWAAYTRIWQEDFFIILRTEISDFEDVEVIEACLGSCIVGNKLVLEYVTGHMDDTMNEKLITYKMQDITEGNRTFLTEETPMAYPKRHKPNDDLLIHIVCIHGHSELVPILLEAGANPNTTGGLAMTPLMYACYFGHLDLARILRGKGADPDLTNDDGDNCLHLAVKAGSTDVVTYLLEELKMDPDVRGRYDRTPLMYAGYDGHLDIVDILIRNKATLNPPSPGVNRNNVLHEAASHGRTSVVKQLVTVHSMDVNTAGFKGRTPLMLVCSYGRLDTVEVLLQHGAKIDDIVDYHGKTCYHVASKIDDIERGLEKTKKGYTNRTPIIFAMLYGHFETFEYLMNEDNTLLDNTCLYHAFRGGNMRIVTTLIGNKAINDLDTTGSLDAACASGNEEVLDFVMSNFKVDPRSSCLHTASYHGKKNILVRLLAMGLDINHRNSYGQTPVMSACLKGHLDIVKLLVERGATWENITDQEGNTIVHVAAKGNNPDILEYFMEKGVSKTSIIRDASVFHMACNFSASRTTEMLLRLGCSVNQTLPGSNCTPLMSHLLNNPQWNSTEMVLTLVQHGADVHTRDNKGNTCLHVVAKYAHTYVVTFLLKAGVDVNTVGFRGRTPLMLACSSGHLDTVKVLLQNGAKIDGIVDYHGSSCYHMASQSGNVDVLKVLLKHSNDQYCLDSRNFNDQTPLMNAVSHSKEEMTRYISNENSSCAEHCDKFGASCLHLAAQSGNLALLKFFLDRGLDKKKKAYKDWTPIIYAMHYGQFETFEYLMNEDSTLLDNTCLYHACRGGNMRIVKTLMDNTAINDLDTTGSLDAACASVNEEVLDFVMSNFKVDPRPSCLHTASYHGKKNILMRLLAMGLDINHRNSYGDTPVMSACLGGHLDIVKLLVERGATWENITHQEGNTIVHVAAKGNNPDILEYFMEKGVSKTSIIGDASVFHMACKSSASRTTEMLLRLGANVHTRDNKGNTCLHVVAQYAHTYVVKLLLKAGVDVNTVGFMGRTPLMLACNSGHLDTVKVLLQNEANIDGIVDYHGSSCYHMASQSGNVDVMKVLLKHSNDQYCLDSRNFNNQTPLMNAVSHSKEEMTYYISNENSSCAEHCDTSGASCLHLAAQSGNLALLKFFLERGLDKNKKAYKGWTPIIYAMHYGQFETFECLMNEDSTLLDNTCLYHACRGGNLDIVTSLMYTEATYDLDTTGLLDAACESGNEEVLDFVIATPNVDPLRSLSCLHAASYHGHRNILVRLLTLGLEINYRNSYRQTPVMSACQGGHLDIVKLLVERGATWENISDQEGNTIVHVAAKGNNPDILEYFMEKGVSKTSIIRDPSVFHMACKSSASRTAEMLLRLGCSVNQTLPGSNCTPLMLPLLNPRWHSADMVLILIQHGADVNARDNEGNTCLHIAARRNQHIFAAKILLEAGIDVNVTNKDDFTPLMVAVHHGQEKMFSFFLTHQADIGTRSSRGASVLEIAWSSTCQSDFIIGQLQAL